MMADEYIRRGDALEDFESCNAHDPKWTPARVKSLLLRQTATDVAPVVRGKPITKIREVTITEYHEARGVFAADGSNVYIKNMVHTEIPYDYCPVCGAVLCSRWHNYCGKCGAKMDGGAEDG